MSSQSKRSAPLGQDSHDTMRSRERVLKSLNHEEPDRVLLDMGGTIISGIMAHALDRLRKHLGLEDRPVKVYEVFQMLGEV